MSTKGMLVTAAARLLDEGGLSAVTLRAVAGEVGISHNAPYRHFSARSDLLSGVAQADFEYLAGAFTDQHLNADPYDALFKATNALIRYARNHSARYQLLFSENVLVPDDALRVAARASFDAFSNLVRRAQGDGSLHRAHTDDLTGLIYATLHGAIELELSGRTHDSKGPNSIERTIGMLLALLGGRELEPAGGERGLSLA